MSDEQRISTYLVIRLGGEPERAVVWDTLDISVGRHASQDISVADPEVSRKHAVFRREDERFCIEDMGTGLGTLVNGERIETRDLAHGDTIQIGMLEIRFGQTPKAIRPEPNVCFASELKQGGLPAATGAAGGRTMLAFDIEDDPPLPATGPVEEARARGVTADGKLEELDDLDPLGLSIDGADVRAAIQARDLDRELLADMSDSRASAAPTLAPLEPVGVRQENGPATSTGTHRPAAESTAPDAGASRSAARLSLEVDGPPEEVEAFVAAVREKRVQFGAVSLKIRDAD